jgi:hypothetical protein
VARALQDLTGQRFTRLVVIERAENDKHGNTQWRCKCDCGNECIALPSDLKRNRKSCGCLKRETAKKLSPNLYNAYREGTPEHERRLRNVAQAREELEREGLGDLPESLLPRRKAGNQSHRAEALYNLQVERFCTFIRQIYSTLDFGIGVRDWCYLLEERGLRKGDFDAGERLITRLRKSGALPLDICAPDRSRSTVGAEKLDDPDIDQEAESWIEYLLESAHEKYTPISFWDDKDVYIEVVVEKLSLLNLFESACAPFRVQITNMKGWSDLNRRAEMMERFKFHEARGRRCILLICCDHDPGGLQIARFVRKNLADMSPAVGWEPSNLIVSRFGLNKDFIDEHGLTWIDNLETSSGAQLDDEDHPDNDKRYVQEYIEQFGVRKCEANALVKNPELGRQLVRDAILEYLDEDSPEEFEDRLEPYREQLREALAARIVDEAA